MRKKNKLRVRIEALEVGRTITLRDTAPNSRAYRQANNFVQRVRLSSARTFRLRISWNAKSKASLLITRLT